MKNNLLSIACALICGAILGGCNGEEPPAPTTVKVASVSVSPTILKLDIGGTATLTPTVLPADAADKSITWNSDATAVATVDSGGKVTAVAEGKATITVTTTDGAKRATCAVTVTRAAIAVTEVSVDPTSLALDIGGTATLKATVTPEDADDKTVAWSSSAPAVATVDASTGEVTAIAPGEATITATAGGRTASCTVTVTEPVSGQIPDAVLRNYLLEQGYIRIVDPLAGTLEVTSEGQSLTELYLQNLAAKSIAGIEIFPALFALGVPTTVEELDLSLLPNLTFLSYHGDKLTSIDFSHTSNIDELYLGGKGITSVDTSLLPKVWLFACRCPGVTSIDLAGMPGLTYLYLDGSGVTTVDLSQNPILEYLDCHNTGIREIDISKNQLLGSVYLNDTPLEKIYVWWDGGMDGKPIYLTTFQVPGGVQFINNAVSKPSPLTLLPAGVDPRSSVVSYTATPAQWEQLHTVYCFSELLKVTRDIYSIFNDDFDYIFYVLDSQQAAPVGFYAAMLRVSNSVQGTGVAVESYSHGWGSAGKLQSVMYYPQKDRISFGPSLHEIAHNWAAFIKPQRYNPDDTVENGGHWSVTNAGGQLGGFRYIRTVEENSGGVPGKTLYQASFNPDKNSDGSFKGGFGDIANGGNGPAYSDIELYLMGMKSAQELRDANFTLDVYSGNSWESDSFQNGYFWSTKKTSYTIDDIIELNGPRIPDAASSQKSFKVLTVVLTREGQTTHHYADIIKGVQWLAGPENDNTYGTGIKNFKQATYGRGTLVVDGIKNSLKPETRSGASHSVTPPATPLPKYDRGRIHIDRIDDNLIVPYRR